ncbi:MAG: SAM-dependent chlorinase/fluorinase [Solirubrobacterales bacterium]
MTPRTVAFLTDFGLNDPFVGICHGVILSEDRSIPIVDVTHSVPRQNVRAGAQTLADAAPFMPAETVFLAVVDPGVGSDRRAVAIATADGSILVGPDNGLLTIAVEIRGGARRAFEISESDWCHETISPTFHGRDVFAPVAAKLAGGASIEESGEEIPPDSLVTFRAPRAEWSGDALATSVIDVDDFGNVRLAGNLRVLGDIYRGQAFEVRTEAGRAEAMAAATYSDGHKGNLLLIEDSTGALALCVTEGSAAEQLKLAAGDKVRLRPTG